MDPFRRLALFTVVRDAGFVALTGFTLMVAFSFMPQVACAAGASVALMFAVGLLFRVGRLTEEHLPRIEAWRYLPKEERPAGDSGRRWARDNLEDIWLRFAKGAAGAAIVLYSAGLVASLLWPETHI